MNLLGMENLVENMQCLILFASKITTITPSDTTTFITPPSIPLICNSNSNIDYKNKMQQKKQR